MAANFIRIGLIIFSWLSLIFLPKKSWDRYLPVSIFTSLLVLSFCILSMHFKWWVVKGGIIQRAFNDLSFIVGPFFAGTLWIFHFTFGKFKRYLLLNAVMDGLLAFPLNYLFQKVKMYQFINFRPLYLFIVHTFFAFIMYGYQLLVNRVNIKKVFF